MIEREPEEQPEVSSGHSREQKRTEGPNGELPKHRQPSGVASRTKRLMVGKRQKRRRGEQLSLTFAEDRRDEVVTVSERVEPTIAELRNESPTEAERMMEEVCQRANLNEACKRVRENKGSPGIDGMTVEGLTRYLRKRGDKLREELLSGTYKPKPVKRVEIPKPDGGIRKLGIPTVADRLVQQAILQVLQPKWDASFSEHSYGFRPGRSAHQGVARAQEYIKEGYDVVVDIDLEKFFDRVNHDILMNRVARRISDKRVLKLIRAFLNAGVLEGGLVSPTEEGTPQGGPFTP